MRRFVAMTLAAALVGGCSAGQDTAATQQAVAQFHQRLDAGQFDSIYDQAGPELKAITPKAQFLPLLAAIHSRLGAVKQAKQVGWNVNYGTGGGTISLTYDTQFASGSGTEQFIYRTGRPPLLVGYHIQSNDLFIK
jgi:hypothetical protein